MGEINIATIITLGILIFFTVKGYRKGFVKLLVSLLSMILTLVLVWIVTPYISDYLTNNTGMYSSIKENLDTAFEDANSKRDNTVYENQVETINSYEVPDLLKTVLAQNNTEDIYRKLAVTIFEDYVSAFLSRMIIRILSFVVTYILIMLFLKMTVLSMSFIVKIPVIKGINKYAGLVFGFAEGMFICWIGFMLATVFAGAAFMNMVHGSRILNFLYTNNIILRLIAG